MRRVVAVLTIAALTLGAWAASFDGQPTAPQPFVSPEFDVQVHNRDAASTGMAQVVAQHGSDCAGPPATHVQAGGVFVCKDHVMTTLNEEGYGVIYLTPNQMVNFAQGGTVSFELSTERMSTRDWWDITVSPFTDTQALPLLSDLSQNVDLQGPNRNSVVITTDNGTARPDLKVVRNGAVTTYASSGAFNAGVTAANQAATRQTFMLTLSPTHVRFERLASSTGGSALFFERDIPALSWTQGVVQFGHHSYNPSKDNAGQPATWHWDQFQIAPAAPFTLIQFPTRATAGSTITANAPAPSGAYLRFSAICKPTVNGVSPVKMVSSGHPEHFSSYLMPIAAGTQTFNVSFSADSWYGTNFGCLMKDYSIVALGGVPSPSASASPSVTATATSSPVPTASSSPSSAPPSATPQPTPTSTPTPVTYSCVRSDGTIIWQGETAPRSCP